MVNRFWW